MQPDDNQAPPREDVASGSPVAAEVPGSADAIASFSAVAAPLTETASAARDATVLTGSGMGGGAAVRDLAVEGAPGKRRRQRRRGRGGKSAQMPITNPAEDPGAPAIDGIVPEAPAQRSNAAGVTVDRRGNLGPQGAQGRSASQEARESHVSRAHPEHLDHSATPASRARRVNLQV